MKEESWLRAILEGSPVLWSVIQGAEALGLERYYVGGGCIAQTVWNHLNRLPPLHGISDFDLAYYDQENLNWSAEDQIVRRANALLGGGGVPLDVKNQARVHFWYPERFGREIPPYPSLEAALSTWPTTATAVGVRLSGGKWTVYAPFGLEDLFAQVVRPNPVLVSREVYERKCARWHAVWPTLRLMPWPS